MFTNSCAPQAIRIALGISYGAACERVRRARGDPCSVTYAVFKRLLGKRITKETRYRRTRPFMQWREGKQGLWLVIAKCEWDRGAHALVLRDGKAYDNGWAAVWRERLRVHVAWRLR